jgi:hypothetical protein
LIEGPPVQAAALSDPQRVGRINEKVIDRRSVIGKMLFL